jgi:N-acetylglutamate synthase-like GNAT family acetyltransferase
MQTALNIRNAAPDDAESIASVIVPIQQQEFGVNITYEQQPDLIDIGNYYQTGTGGFWIAEVDGKPVGTIALKDIGNNEGALRKMFVSADYRGAPLHIAKNLLDHLIGHARTQNLTKIYLGTVDKFTAAHRFYEKNGFIDVRPKDLPASFPRMAVDTKFYMLKI